MKRLGEKNLTAKFAALTWFGMNAKTVTNTALLTMTAAKTLAVVGILKTTWFVTFATENMAGTFVQTATKRK